MPRKAGSTTATKIEVKPENSEVNISEVLSLLQEIKKENDQLRDEVKQLKTREAEIEVSSTSIEPYTNPIEDNMNKLLESLANNRNNKESTIVHGQEMFGGLCTFIHLSNLDISFSHVGETRVLSCQQFEELCSKYRGFIDEGIIKISPKNRDLCHDYHIQCYEDEDTTKVLTPEILAKLPNMTNEELASTYNSLDASDQKVMLNYWLGQCYARPEERDKRFYDRYKLEFLNNLSNSFVFDNIIADMNHA